MYDPALAVQIIETRKNLPQDALHQFHICRVETRTVGLAKASSESHEWLPHRLHDQAQMPGPVELLDRENGETGHDMLCSRVLVAMLPFVHVVEYLDFLRGGLRSVVVVVYLDGAKLWAFWSLPS